MPTLPPTTKPDHTRIFFSGMSGAGAFPETMLVEYGPDVMLSFFDLKHKTDGATAWQRFGGHIKRTQSNEARK